MSFLAPLFLAGALLVAAPVIFHLMRRAPRNRIAFSSTEFLEASPPLAKRSRRIQNPLLLLLRCLVVALLALAFARPFLSDGESVSGLAAQPRSVVLALDRSASMGREAIWEAARDAAATLIDELRPGDRLAMLAFADTVDRILAADQWLGWPLEGRPEMAKRLLDQLSPTDFPGRLDLAAEAALQELDVLRETSEEQGAGEIWILSDFAEGTTLAGLAGVEWPSDAVIRRVPLAGERPEDVSPNLGLGWLGWSSSSSGFIARLALASDRPTIEISATIRAYGPETGVEWANLGPVRMQSQEQRVIEIELPAEAAQRPLVFNLESDDAAAFDNRLYVAPPFIPSVVAHSPSLPQQDDPASSAYFIARAFAGIERPRIDLSRLPETGAATPNLIIVDHPLDAATNARIADQLRAGAHVLALVASPDQAADLDRLAGIPGWQVRPIERAPALFGSIDFTHPLFSQYSDPRYSDFTGIRVWNPLSVHAPATAETHVLVRYDDETPAVLEAEVGEGRLIVWAHGWAPADSNWALSTKFVPWLHRFASRSIGGAAPSSNAELRAQTLSAYSEFSDWRLIGATESKRTPDQAGLYRARSPQGDRWVAWQLAPEESALKPIDADSWDALGLPDGAIDPQRQQPQMATEIHQGQRAIELEQSQKLWQWLIAGTLLLLALESALAIVTRQKRERLAS